MSLVVLGQSESKDPEDRKALRRPISE